VAETSKGMLYLSIMSRVRNCQRISLKTWKCNINGRGVLENFLWPKGPRSLRCCVINSESHSENVVPHTFSPRPGLPDPKRHKNSADLPSTKVTPTPVLLPRFVPFFPGTGPAGIDPFPTPDQSVSTPVAMFAENVKPFYS
jgi:hypothetical protein